MALESLTQAQTLLEQLVEAAKEGTIIPIILPSQLEEIQGLLNQAQEEAERNTPAPPPPEMEAFLQDQAVFISHAIHELRTPMTSIRGYTDMMRSMGDLNDMQKQFVETIRSNARRMETLLTDVSDISKIKAGTLRLNQKMDMFKNIALMVEKQSQPVAEQLNRRLSFDIPQGLPILNVDGELLAKAIYKLVENALRYNTNAEGEVKVVASAEGNKLIIQVQDNGIGMTPEEMAQLGTIYFRADSETVRTYKGSGLGIPVAYGIVRMLGGSTDVTSEVGKGTTFTIKLTGMT